MRVAVLFIVTATVLSGGCGVACQRGPPRGMGDAGAPPARDAGEMPEDAGSPALCISLPKPTSPIPVDSLPVTPSIAWDLPIPNRPLAPGLAFADGTLYAAVASTLYAINNGAIKWQTRSAGGELFSAPSVIGIDEVVVAGDDLTAYSTGGTLRWRLPIGHSDMVPRNPLVAPSLIVDSGADGVLRGVTMNGTLAWSTEVGHWGAQAAVPLGGAGSTAFLLEESGTRVVSVDTGATLRSFSSEVPQAFRLASAEFGELFAAQFDSREGRAQLGAVAYDSCLARRWSLGPSNEPELLGPGELLVTRVVDVVNHESVLRNRFVAPDGRIMGTLVDGGVPLAVGGDGTLYVARCPSGSSASIVAVSLSDGGVRWELPLLDRCPSPHAVLADGGQLIIVIEHDTDLRVIAISTGSPGVGGAWPLRRHDLSGTGWAP